MWNSVTGTVEASSGRASQQKPGQGLIAVTLRGDFFFVHSLSETLTAVGFFSVCAHLVSLSSFRFDPSQSCRYCTVDTVRCPLVAPHPQCSPNMCFQSRVESMLAKTPQHWRATASDATGRRGMKCWGRLRLCLFYSFTLFPCVFTEELGDGRSST